MINLLPLEQKEILRQESNWRLVLILGFLTLVFLLCLSLALFSIKVHITGQAEFQKILFESAEKEFQSSEIQSLKTEVGLINQELLAIDSFYQEQSDLTKLSKDIVEVLPNAIYLTIFRFSEQISLNGYASDRDTLLDFKEKLEENPNFEEFYFPAKNLIEQTDINFDLSFRLRK